MPALVRLYIVNIAIGIGLGVIFTALLIGFDVANLRHLILASPAGWLAVLMLVFFNSLVFSGVQFAIAIMRMAEPDDRPKGGRRIRVLRLPAQPVLIRVTEKDARRG